MAPTIPNDAYRELSETPSYKTAEFLDSNAIRVVTSTTDHVRKIARQNVKTFFVSEDSVSAVTSPDGSDVVASAASPSRKYLAVLRETGDKEKKRFVEVWKGDRVVATEEVTEKHGVFYTDESISGISFAPSETKLVYVAEASSREPYSSASASRDDADPFASFRFVPPLGESYQERAQPRLFLFEWSTDSNDRVKLLTFTDPAASKILPAQPVFTTDDKILCIGYEHAPDGRLLGIVYCTNRAAGVWELTLPDTSAADETPKELQCHSTQMAETKDACRSLRVFTHAQGSYAIWLSSTAGGPHAKSARLHVLDLQTNAAHVQIETVWDPTPTAFPGIYTSSLPRTPFLRLPDAHVVFSSTCRSRNLVFLVSLATGDMVVHNLTQDDAEAWSWNVLCTDGERRVLCSRSAPHRPQELVLGTFGPNKDVSWRVLAKPELSPELQTRLSDLHVSLLDVPGRYPTQTIVLRNKNSTASTPCITNVHGGPHSASTTAFFAWTAAVALEGYTVSSPNYTGSTGYGDAHVHALVGRVGELDVADCMAAVDHLVARSLAAHGPGKQFLSGGSHGGFLVTHLIGQHPTTFTAALARNPVTHLGEPGASDILDWYFAVLGEAHSPTAVIAPELYARAFAASPIAHVDAVRTPLVIMLGLKDQRVAPSQGKLYYHALKGRERDVEMLCFRDDIHALDGVEAQRVAFDAAKSLFARVRGVARNE